LATLQDVPKELTAVEKRWKPGLCEYFQSKCYCSKSCCNW